MPGPARGSEGEPLVPGSLGGVTPPARALLNQPLRLSPCGAERPQSARRHPALRHQHGGRTWNFKSMLHWQLFGPTSKPASGCQAAAGLSMIFKLNMISTRPTITPASGRAAGYVSGPVWVAAGGPGPGGLGPSGCGHGPESKICSGLQAGPGRVYNCNYFLTMQKNWSDLPADVAVKILSCVSPHTEVGGNCSIV